MADEVKNAQNDSAAIEAAILALGSKGDGENGKQSPPPPPGPAAESARPAEAAAEHSSEQPGQPKAVRYSFTFPEPIWKHHRSRVLSETDPEKLVEIVRSIEHIKEGRGRQKGCQCFDCKNTRGEVHIFESAGGSDSAPIDPILSELLSEELIADILEAPNKAMALVTQIRKLPKEIQEIWEPEAKRLELYGRYGKLIVDKYAHLPDFKHKELIVFGGWYGLTFTGRLGMMLAMLKTMEKK